MTFFADDSLMAARKLTLEEQEIAFEHAIAGDTLTATGEALGFKTRMAFYEYCKRDPDFSKALHDARVAGNDYIEDELRHITSLEENPNVARVRMESLCRLLTFRNPAKYSQRIDVNVTQTVDIGSSLARMHARLLETYAPQQLDVTPKLNDINDLL